MGQPAARVGDIHFCPAMAPIPHVGGPVLLGAQSIQIGGQSAARRGDLCLCLAIPAQIARGAMPVRMETLPAARKTDPTSHGGLLTQGLDSVLIGLAGDSGNKLEGQAACEAAREGRNPPPGTLDDNGNPIASNTPWQSYNNCGVEASRQIINRSQGSNLTQEQLLDQAISSGIAGSDPNSLFNSGGTSQAGLQQLWQDNNVAGHLEPSSLENLETAVAQGQGVAVELDADTLWSNGLTPQNMHNHVVTATGVRYDENGNVTHVIINDTGQGTCSQAVPIDVWNSSTNAGWQNVVTDDPIW
jgi:uncharacterized Zn-binding protein involved in type VI secretion